VQTITSSIDYVTGSTRFGSLLTNTHTFTGSVNITGSISSYGPITSTGNISSQGGIMNVFYNTSAAQPAHLVLADSTNTQQMLIGYNSASQYSSIQSIYQGVGYKNLILNSAGGNVGVGTTNPTGKLDVWGTIISSATAPSNTVGNGPTIYLAGNSGSSYTYLQQGLDRFIFFLYTGGSWYERFTINNVTGNIGMFGQPPRTPSAVKALESTNWVLEDNGSFGIKNNNYYNGTNNIYISNTTAERIYISNGFHYYDAPSGTAGGTVSLTERFTIANGGNVGIGTTSPGSMLEVSGSILSTTGQFSTTRTVTISALNTSVLIFSGAPSGIISARDNTNGGSGMWLHDPNGGSTLVAQNWVNGVYTVFYSGGNTYVQKTSGNVPVIFHYVIYGN
jgi:hypothetical protein